MQQNSSKLMRKRRFLGFFGQNSRNFAEHRLQKNLKLLARTEITSMLIFTSKPFLSLNFDASAAPGGVVQGLRAVRPRRVAPELQGTRRLLPARFRHQIHRTECAAGVEGRSRRHNDSRRGARSSRKLYSFNALC